MQRTDAGKAGRGPGSRWAAGRGCLRVLLGAALALAVASSAWADPDDERARALWPETLRQVLEGYAAYERGRRRRRHRLVGPGRVRRAPSRTVPARIAAARGARHRSEPRPGRGHSARGGGPRPCRRAVPAGPRPAGDRRRRGSRPVARAGRPAGARLRPLRAGPDIRGRRRRRAGPVRGLRTLRASGATRTSRRARAAPGRRGCDLRPRSRPPSARASPRRGDSAEAGTPRRRKNFVRDNPTATTHKGVRYRVLGGTRLPLD